MANSAAPTLLVLLAGGLIVLVLFGSQLIAFGTQIFDDINTAIANFFSGLGGSTGLLPTPTPTPGGGPTPTPGGGGSPTPTPTHGTVTVTVAVQAPTTSPWSSSCTVLWTDETDGVMGSINLLTYPSGSVVTTITSGDLVSFMASYSGTGCHLDHWTVSGGGNTNANPLTITISSSITVTAYFVAN